MRVPHSLRLVVATWIAALFGALTGRAIAQASNATPRGAHVTVSGDRVHPD
ncbi:MAG: hypothetical protein WBY94_12940 [Polyangiaceae bacterium]